MQKKCRNRPTPRSIVLAFAGALSFVANLAQADQVNCGDVLTEDTVFENDLSECPGDALVIGADHITVDLNGHTILGGGCVSGSEEGTVGIRMDDRRQVVVRNGKVWGFGTGIVLDKAHHNVLEAMDVSANFQGLVLSESDHNRMASLKMENNCLNAIALVASNHNRIEGSEATANGFELSKPAIVLSDSQGNVIGGNTVGANADDGIELRGSRNNQMAGNTLQANLGHGIELIDSGNNLVGENETLDNLIGIAVGLGSTGNHLRGNTASGNGGVDLRDDNPDCDHNHWKQNTFSTSSSDSNCIE